MVEAGDFEAVTGQGVRGTVDGRPVALGNIRLLRDMGLDAGTLIDAADAHSTWMLATDTFSHTGANGSSAGDRTSRCPAQRERRLALASSGASSRS